ncbi:MAG: 23S rRNA (guanosine(2251)-2'-O)-methyltransferase RlmB [Acidimicrobiia bacterium]
MARAGIGTDLEGIHAVEAAVDSGRVKELTVEHSRRSNRDVSRILSKASAMHIDHTFVDDVRPLAATNAPQGIVARATPIPAMSLNQIVETDVMPALLVVDHVEDPRNIGAAARSAYAAGMTGLVVSDRRSAPIGATAFKAAVGALEHLPVAVVSSVADAMKRLGKLGLWRVGLDGGGDRSILGLDLLDQPVAVCVGAEGSGLSHLVSERCDVVAKIPMVGAAESLNASVAASLACFEVARMRGWLS